MQAATREQKHAPSPPVPRLLRQAALPRPRRYDYEPGRRRSTVPFRGAVIVLLALTALVVLASLT